MTGGIKVEEGVPVGKGEFKTGEAEGNEFGRGFNGEEGSFVRVGKGEGDFEISIL